MPNGKRRPVYESKCWGSCLHGYINPNVAVSLLNLEKGSWCSRHRHKHRANVFWCLTALVEIQEWDLDGNELITLLEPGDVYEIPVGVLHRFNVLEDGEMIELYYSETGGEVSIDDIQREDVGGKHGQR